MAAINLRVPNGIIPLTNQQVDDNFQNLNNALGAGGSTTIPTYTGTGGPVLSISPTLTGTLKVANITYTGGIIGGTSVINIGSNQIYKDASGKIGIGGVPTAVVLEILNTGSMLIPKGTTTERPTGVTGYIRYNTSLSVYEGYGFAGWGALGGGATGGPGDAVFFENSKVISSNYTITVGKNAMCTGPITTSAGITITVPSGSRWVVL